MNSAVFFRNLEGGKWIPFNHKESLVVKYCEVF